MGKRSAVGELFLGNMGSIQREIRPSIQREDQLTMETKLEQIAAGNCEPPIEERSAVNPHATFCGSGRRRPPPATRCEDRNILTYSALRLEWRGQDGQSEVEQPDHPASLGDSITASYSDEVFGTHSRG